MNRGSSIGKVSSCVLFALVLAVGLSAQAPDGKAVERLDPALDAIVSADAKPELLGDQFGLTEGPLWIQDERSGYLLFSDIPANVIRRWTPDRQLSVFLEKSGYTGTDASYASRQTGSNGLTLDLQGRVLVATHGNRNVVRLEKDGTRTVLADRYDGKRLNSPNDLVVKSNGALYFTDPSYGLPGRESSPVRELPFNGVYLAKDGKLVLLDKDPQSGVPNGIAFSPDEKYLYVSCLYEGGSGKIVRYEIQPDDTIANGRVLIDSGSDGMKVDQRGNLYLTTRGGVWVVSADGKHVGTIHLPKGVTRTTNVAFGDADRKTLYITAGEYLYRIRVNVPGSLPGVRR